MTSSASISGRISRIVVVAVATGISVSVGIFLLSDFRQSMRSETLRYESAAYAFAAASSDGVAERDPRKILEVIRGVRSLAEVTYVAALDQNANIIAEIGAGARLISAPLNPWSLIPTTIEVSAEVRKGGSRIGSITMRAEAKDILGRYLNAIMYAALLGAALVGITSVLAKMQVSRVVRPLRALSEEFVDIGHRSDLTRRLKKERNDEVGVLVDAFNEMFGHIDDRDRLLKRHRETLEDTVERRTIELKLAKDDADAANAAKSTFLATMSHEIRTPMNGMMVMAEMLAAAPLAPKHLRYAEIITRSGKNLVHIINDILDFSKVESGKIELEEIEFSIDAVIEDTACLFAERANEKGLSLGIYIAPETPRKLLGDPVRLTQIVSNLVNNALKFTESGGVAISVEWVSQTNEVAISVKDTGIGVSADQIDRIFSRFSQADSSITRKFGGTGLGLSISKQLTELMGGRVRVESSFGEGSCFIVSIPFEVVEPAKPFVVQRPISVALYDRDTISELTVARALVARGLKVTDEETVDCDAVILRVGNSGVLPAQFHAPLVLLRPFAATTITMPKGAVSTVEIPLPLSRDMLDRLCTAVYCGHLQTLETISGTNSQPPIIPNLSALKVLAVDDVAVNREVLAEALKTFSIDCDLAENGADAIACVQAKTYDVIFMDCSMPGMDGFEATRTIRVIENKAARSPALVIALTGHLMDEKSGEWIKAGMNGYLAKPFNIGQLNSIFRGLDVIDSTAVSTVAVNDDPLISAATLEMFDSIRASTGADVRGRVFAMFREGALASYNLAANEITIGGGESKRLIHALKSNCSSTGAARATSLCQQIETDISAGIAPEPQLLQTLHSVLLETVAAMDQLEAAGQIAA